MDKDKNVIIYAILAVLAIVAFSTAAMSFSDNPAAGDRIEKVIGFGTLVAAWLWNQYKTDVAAKKSTEASANTIAAVETASKANTVAIEAHMAASTASRTAEEVKKAVEGNCPPPGGRPEE